MNKPLISFIGPAHRTELWRLFYNSIITNLDFEVVFVTDKEPLQEETKGLDKLKWIYSPVKPAQCFEIAYRQSQGDFIIWCGDDIVYAPYALDHLYCLYTSLHNYKAVVACRFCEDGYENTPNYCLPWDDKVKLTTTGIINKKVIDEVGGLADVNFVTGHWDGDLMMRIMAIGGKVYICPVAWAYEPHNEFHKKEANFAENWRWELDYFTSLWSVGGKTTYQRQKPFMPYSEVDILTKSQGNKGKWI